MQDPQTADPGQETIRVGEHSHVLARASRADDRTRVLKHGDTFAVFDRYSDIFGDRLGDQGLYHAGTRHVSRLDLLINQLRPLLLSSSLDRENLLLLVDLTNPDLSEGDEIVVPRGSLHILRTSVVWEGVLHQRLDIQNFGLRPVRVGLALRLLADFADVFEVRGVERTLPGKHLGASAHDCGIEILYVGADKVARSTRLACDPAPSRCTPGGVEFDVELAAGAARTIDLRLACAGGHAPEQSVDAFDEAVAASRRRVHALKDRECKVRTNSESFNNWVTRSLADLRLMVSQTPWGPYPYAGIPWFSTPFGRDGAITALQTLWVDPDLARGVLAFMAATQADSVNPLADAEPGKIFHEFRQGELAATGQVPYARYYGSVDSTPLYVMLAGEYFRMTGDLEFVRELWPSLRRALEWMDEYGDADGDGFVEYSSSSPHGLTNQGWKDSRDSVFWADGGLAPPPIALCEVQGYVYAARRGAAEIATALGDADGAAFLNRQAETLRDHFATTFWDEQLGLYVEAIDGQRRPCRVATSNAGQVLFSGIAREDHARRIIDDMLSPRFFSGWGIRTVATDQPRYNPMSYHNGSIWPHDTAIIAAGMSRCGRPDAAARIMSAMMDASCFAELYRLPELFCGFPRRPGEGPIRYPVSCAPQSWAAGAVFQMLGACLGLSIRPSQREVVFQNPTLPEFLQFAELKNLRVGTGTADLIVQRRGNDLGINVLRRDAGIRVVLTH